MNRIARLATSDRRSLFTEAGVRLGLPPFHIEKDFWVCFTLATLFQNEALGPNLTFRGGTSLSKGWQCIERFSEDIDLSMARSWLGEEARTNAAEENISDKQKEKRLSRLRKECRAAISDILFPNLDRSLVEAIGEGNVGRLTLETLERAKDPFCLYFYYPAVGFEAPDNYHRAAVKIELSGRAEGWPIEEREIAAYVLKEFPDFADGPALMVSCVRPERTFWEKISLLHEANTRPEAKMLAARQARHLYDLHRLWGHLEIHRTEGFTGLFEAVKEHRQAFFACSWVDYESLTPRDLIILPPGERLAVWRADYLAMKSMFIGEQPSFEEVVESMKLIQEALITE